MTVEAIAHFFSDGVYAKQLTLEKGHTAVTHKHNYSHLSILATGEVEVTLDGVKSHFTAPACIEILAEVSHEIFALEDSTFFCVHQTFETDVNKIDKVLIKE